MGNKHIDGTDVLNPAFAPFLHIEKVGGSYSYIPSAGRYIKVAIYSAEEKAAAVKNAENGWFRGLFGFLFGCYPSAEVCSKSFPLNNSPLEEIAFEVLPEITEIPPHPILVKEHVEGLLDCFYSDISSALSRNPRANLVAVTHGRLWGLSFEEGIAERLRKDGYEVPHSSFYEVGGRKRIQTNAISISR